MLSRLHFDLRDERGSTLPELLVGMAMGMVVLAGLTMVLIVVLHGNARVDSRIEATDNARIGVTRIIEQLHSACITPKAAPVQKESTVDNLIFWHAASGEGNKISPAAVKTEITYNANGTLTQTDRAETGVNGSERIFDGAPSSRILLSNVAPAGEDGGVFTYYKYEGGGPKELSATQKMSATDAGSVILVQVALSASPRSTPVADAGADATVRNSAALRLTPPSYLEETKAYPCQ